MVGILGLEPRTFRLSAECSQPTELNSHIGAPTRNRTLSLIVRGDTFSPLNYRGIGGWYRICTYDAWVAATSLSLLGEPPRNGAC